MVSWPQASCEIGAKTLYLPTVPHPQSGENASLILRDVMRTVSSNSYVCVLAVMLMQTISTEVGTALREVLNCK